jgi:hypothetical protein
LAVKLRVSVKVGLVWCDDDEDVVRGIGKREEEREGGGILR